MTLPAQDTFTTGADATLTTYSANWTAAKGTFGVVASGDYVIPTTAGDECAAFWNADAFNANQYSQAAIGAALVFNTSSIGVAVRCSANNYYALYYDTASGGEAWLFKVVAGAWEQLGRATGIGQPVPCVLRLEVNGTTLTPKLNGTVISGIGAVTDSSLSSGKPGIAGYANETTARLDDWEGGNLGAAGATGSAAITLGGLTATGAGSVTVRGAAAGTLGSLTAVAAGKVTVRGAGVGTLGALSVTGAGSAGGAPVGGAGAIVLGALTGVAAATVLVRGAGAGTLGGVASTGTGSVAVKGAGALSLGGLTCAALGWRLTAATVGGVLTVDPTNGRYFRNSSGIVPLSGFHTWYEFQDGSATYPPAAFDYAAWLDYLDGRGVNLHKMWVMETAREWADADHYFHPLPYVRTGPGVAADGRPRFDLTQYEPAYFTRLRERVIQAGNRGHYVIVQLFQGWQVETKGYAFTPYAYHPYNAGNNINGIDGDTDNDGAGEETRETSFTAVFNLQKAYVAKVIDTLNDLDNVLWEISNEDTANSVAWQHALIDYIHTYEAGKAKRHPVGMTVIYPGGSNSDLTSSNAEWISPNGDLIPEATDGAQVVIFDTDHLVGLTSEHKWVWRAVTRGHNPAYMDEYDGGLYGADTRASAAQERIRRNLGYARGYAARLDLANATPQNGLSGTGYCLAVTTGRYQLLAYQDGAGAFTVNLSSLAGVFAVEWLRTLDGATQAGGNVSGGAVRTLTPPWAGEDVVALLEVAGTAGAGAVTMGGLVMAGAGAVLVTGAGAVTLGELTVVAAGAVTTRGAGAITLSGLAMAGAGSVAISGGGGVTLGALVMAATAAIGDLPTLGAAAIALDSLTCAGAGVVAVTGAGPLALGGLTLAGAGSVLVAGAGAAALKALTCAAAGATLASGNAALALDGPALTATGIVGEYAPATGDAAVALGALTVVGIGTVVAAIVTVWGSVRGPGAAGSATGPRAAGTIDKQ